MKIPYKFFAILGLCFAALLSSATVLPAAEPDETIHFAIIFPGGPSPGGEGKQMIDQFIQHLADMASLDRDNIEGQYFNQISTAVDTVKNYNNIYILGSTGFFLAHRADMKLVPLTTLSMGGTDTEKYYVIVKKGAYIDLDGLKGHTLSGNVLYEDVRFINRIIFNGKIDIDTYFKPTPTLRPLSALRKLNTGGVDAVLVNEMQYRALQTMPLFKEIDTVYISQPIPALGLMMNDTAVNNGIRDRVVTAVGQMCAIDEGRDICRNFGLEGFNPIKEGQLSDVLRKYK